MYEAKCLVPYVPTHNVAMLVSAALYSGRMQLAVEYSPYILMSPESAVYLSAIYASPKDIVMVRYGQWDQVFYLHEQQQKVRVKARIKNRAKSWASAFSQYLSYCILSPSSTTLHHLAPLLLPIHPPFTLQEYERLQAKEQEALTKGGGIFSLGGGKGKDEGKISTPTDYLDATTVPPYVRRCLTSLQY